MRIANGRLPTWASLILLGVVLLVLGIPTLFVFMRLTAKKVHPAANNISSVTGVTALPQWADAVERARELVRSRMSENNLAGISVAVGRDGEIVWTEGFGVADVESGSPVEPAHRFRTGTAAIVFTSAAIGVLLDEGKLTLDDEIGEHVANFPDQPWPVTVRQVMGGVAGFPPEDPDNGVLTSGHCESPNQAIPLFTKDPLPFEPGTRFIYSTFGWVLLSAVVENAAKTPFDAFLQTKLFGPLGMRDTFKEVLADPPSEATTVYNPRFAANPVFGLTPLPAFDYSCHAGSNGFLSTPADLVSFGMEVRRGKLLRPSTGEVLQTPQRLNSGEQTSSGLGWSIKTITVAGRPIRAIGHNGHFWSEDVSSILTLPDSGLTIAVMSNVSFAGTSALAEELAVVFAEAAAASSGR